MYYTPKERIDIGRKVFTHAMTKDEAAKEYGVTETCINNYVKEYMKEQGIPIIPQITNSIELVKDYTSMTKDQLIAELMLKDIEIERAKKGYTVKGGGKTKVYSILKDQNIK